jgi:hypothetical protein
MSPQEFFREGLGAFEAGGGARRTEAGEGGGGEPVDDAGDEGAFGADDGQIDALLRCEREQSLDVLRGDRDIGRVRFRRRAGVAGGDVDVPDARRRRDLPRERRLAAAAADNQDVH